MPLKRDPYMVKKRSEKRPICVERDPYVWIPQNYREATAPYQPINRRYPITEWQRRIYVKRDPYVWKETHMCEFLRIERGYRAISAYWASLTHYRVAKTHKIPYTATHYNTLQTHCNTLQYTAAYCNTLQQHFPDKSSQIRHPRALLQKKPRDLESISRDLYPEWYS